MLKHFSTYRKHICKRVSQILIFCFPVLGYINLVNIKTTSICYTTVTAQKTRGSKH